MRRDVVIDDETCLVIAILNQGGRYPGQLRQQFYKITRLTRQLYRPCRGNKPER